MERYFFLLILAAFSREAHGCCEFNGKSYQFGEVLKEACIHMACVKYPDGYGWNTTNVVDHKRCRECLLWDDPHIITFDQSPNFYNFHGTCKYSVAEYIKDWGKQEDPIFGVYGNFRPCDNGHIDKPSCLHITTYQANAHLFIDFDHTNFQIRDSLSLSVWLPSTMSIPTTPTPIRILNVNYPLLAWRYGNCIWILGPDLLLYGCRYWLHVYASTEYHEQLGGLCGYFNGNYKDDHRSRDGTFNIWETNPTEFPVTWLVPVQPEAECRKEQIKDECSLDELNNYRDKCANEIKGSCKANDVLLQNFIDACAEDSCAFPEEISRWIKVAIEICFTELQLQRGNRILIKEEAIKKIN